MRYCRMYISQLTISLCQCDGVNMTILRMSFQIRHLLTKVISNITYITQTFIDTNITGGSV